LDDPVFSPMPDPNPMEVHGSTGEVVIYRANAIKQAYPGCRQVVFSPIARENLFPLLKWTTNSGSLARRLAATLRSAPGSREVQSDGYVALANWAALQWDGRTRGAEAAAL
jgi:hypothetical protein